MWVMECLFRCKCIGLVYVQCSRIALFTVGLVSLRKIHCTLDVSTMLSFYETVPKKVLPVLLFGVDWEFPSMPSAVMYVVCWELAPMHFTPRTKPAPASWVGFTLLPREPH